VFSASHARFPDCNDRLRSLGQLPSRRKLSAEDEREFNQELKRLDALLPTANDKAAIQLQIANTYTAGGQHPCVPSSRQAILTRSPSTSASMLLDRNS